MLEASDAFPARPRYFDDLEVFDAADGQVLFGIFKRRKGFVYFLCRYQFKALRALVRAGKRLRLIHPDEPEPVNPNPFEIQGFVTAAETAEAYIEEKLKENPREAYQYGPVAVNRFFPDEPVRWRGLVRHTRLWKGRRGPRAQPLFKMVDCAEWQADRRELEEWRAGRRETDCNAELRRTLTAALDLGERVRRLEVQVAEMRKGA